MHHLTNDEFFSRLAELFHTQKGKDHGAIYLSQRRLVRGEKDALGTDADDNSDNWILEPQALIIRATNGKSKKHRKEKIRLTTTVAPDALTGFYARYAETCKAGMTLLKPRDKSKKKAKAKKKKSTTTTPGP
ncbi:signal recognition particle subunit SRP14 [Sporothrix schenckii 1099-18]|uniref:Signal recognition particle subunit SRP14 n=1 Tax=Sporothrix schenckii 1099-18 TaxID=1397361 RepID=A0A0F2LVG0_SPOSC|nr:signal recognition particle subunit SRP14 [Sporothrix schenckii 1099-18]KJR79896.1 signal recognition particle subunit SRP14 [Sporothrix schenckii 1099-18]